MPRLPELLLAWPGTGLVSLACLFSIASGEPRVANGSVCIVPNFARCRCLLRDPKSRPSADFLVTALASILRAMEALATCHLPAEHQ